MQPMWPEAGTGMEEHPYVFLYVSEFCGSNISTGRFQANRILAVMFHNEMIWIGFLYSSLRYIPLINVVC